MRIARKMCCNYRAVLSAAERRSAASLSHATSSFIFLFCTCLLSLDYFINWDNQYSQWVNKYILLHITCLLQLWCMAPLIHAVLWLWMAGLVRCRQTFLSPWGDRHQQLLTHSNWFNQSKHYTALCSSKASALTSGVALSCSQLPLGSFCQSLFLTCPYPLSSCRRGSCFMKVLEKVNHDWEELILH